MQEVAVENEVRKGFKINDLSLEERQRLVGAFAWLIEQDKKQNPALYQPKKQDEDDRYNMPSDTQE
ncbi:MAG: hypothetical protein UX49_C0021G0008 [Candidatus Wolfebacteria bacterium GW2011_GWC2_46_275]|uniref:Uncharacterized protein n=2 Tax=Candidatus Wolfeibacteriota TaxID=1752735 RepID=A0A0G1X851_9BACT|nr:MAG: hypothetical protein UX70_C0001G0811 [Candidatus Wolfebacteria bacterium GW2011_GWB1_47_1]KKU36184.1 MAG: hypothetical protein UX49_C0021G0008 [Candidatus Wolfebacteria bacterium GW2011_GWC2_46_275]KKU42099.1 MAG: hypothetical protein UX58_C0003G0023 [Candidatus Wolfebacteria bacterium GW2011_GWB2_46_69]KKU53727.1 MAG: hypothetical protein UX76_C0011G0072 [Candidatus Wolfebacteria bacterium GW2011_GWC1_47_103]KKU59312.1 MAG: hypothetical protein UX83_C0006G0082 [Candidatus Wolfebacteria